tara:strand:- start:24 stop:302 length:279 start_codon:yes stop_codon:yes gene_type:complete
MRITRKQLRQIIQEALNESNHGDPALSRPGTMLGSTGKYFYDRMGTQADWNKEDFLADLKDLQQHLPKLIAHVESVEGDSYSDVLGFFWSQP